MLDNFDWVLFDADHTLFDFDRSARASLITKLNEHGIPFNDDDIELYFSINKACWRAYEEGKIDRHTLIRRRFEEFFEQIHVKGKDPLAFNAEYLAELPKHPYFLEGAPEVLDVIGAHFQMGIITNGLKEVQRPRLGTSGITDYFKVIVVSGEIGIAKPDHAYFDYAHKAMQLPEKECVLVVGDNLFSDMYGAINFGFQSCWYNPDEKPTAFDIKPDFQVRSHTELIALLTGS